VDGEVPNLSVVDRLIANIGRPYGEAYLPSMISPVEEAASASPRDVDSLPPVVVRTQPASGARNVAPGIAEVRVKFSKAMADGSWSWSSAWENSTPEPIAEPTYEDSRTCRIRVKLEPGKAYAWWLNSETFQNFKDTTGQPAVPYLLIFQTRGKEVAP